MERSSPALQTISPNAVQATQAGAKAVRPTTATAAAAAAAPTTTTKKKKNINLSRESRAPLSSALASATSSSPSPSSSRGLASPSSLAGAATTSMASAAVKPKLKSKSKPGESAVAALHEVLQEKANGHPPRRRRLGALQPTQQQNVNPHQQKELRQQRPHHKHQKKRPRRRGARCRRQLSAGSAGAIVARGRGGETSSTVARCGPVTRSSSTPLKSLSSPGRRRGLGAKKGSNSSMSSASSADSNGGSGEPPTFFEKSMSVQLLEDVISRLIANAYTTKGPVWDVGFRRLDTDHDGVLDWDEFRRVMRKQGVRLKSAHIEQLFDLMDVDGSGAIELQDFRDFMEDHAQRRAAAPPALHRKRRRTPHLHNLQHSHAHHVHLLQQTNRRDQAAMIPTRARHLVSSDGSVDESTPWVRDPDPFDADESAIESERAWGIYFEQLPFFETQAAAPLHPNCRVAPTARVSATAALKVAQQDADTAMCSRCAFIGSCEFITLQDVRAGGQLVE